MRTPLTRSLLVASLLLIAAGSAEQLAAQDEARVRELIGEGIALHDKKMYPEAIAKYEEAWALDSANPLLFYEMGYTYSSMGDDRKSLEVALLGTTFDSPYRGALYLIVGNSYDHLGKPEKAVEAYEEGIDLMPDDGMLRYNLGLTYIGMNEIGKATDAVKAGLFRKPHHPSGHLLLATIFDATGERIPAVLSLIRFLTLEPTGPRTAASLEKLHTVLGSGVKPSGSEEGTPKQINITIGGEPTAEGDFTTVDLMLGLGLANTLTDSTFADAPPVTRMEHVLSLMFGMFSEAGMRKPGFTADYYVPFFAALHRAGHTEALAYYISAGDGDPEIAAWFAVDANDEKVSGFREWMEGYAWSEEEE